MPGIDWAYLGSLGGEGLESFAATCLRQRHPDAVQTRPASGDQGIDVYRHTPAGLIVWQIKRFTTPVTSDQQKQIKRSWKRFWDSKVLAGVPIVSYALATPWTPTEAKRGWFFNEVCSDASFEVVWEGEAFFNMLASEFPPTADRFFKGHDMLENMVNAKAVLAASPVESADSLTMLEAVTRREASLREIKDMVSDNYEIDTSILRTRPGEDGIPWPPANDLGLHHRYTRLDDKRWQVDTVVPKNTQATEIEPLRLDVRFLVEPGSPEAKAVEQWRVWGIPFADVEAESQQLGGPLADPEPVRGLLSLRRPDVAPDLPRVALTALSDDGTSRPALSAIVREVTRGVEGDGLRVVASTRSRVLELEVRVGSAVAENEFDLRLNPDAGRDPSLVALDLQKLDAIKPEDTLTCIIEDGPALTAGTGLTPPPLASIVRTIAEDLARLQPHTSERLPMPDISMTTDHQAEDLHRLAVIFDEGAIEELWERLVLTISDPSFLTNRALFNGQGALVLTHQPEFTLGDTTYRITRTLAHQYLTPRLAPGVNRATLGIGDELELVPGHDARLVHAAVADDTGQASDGD